MLRLSALTFVGLIISFLAFGGELSPEEKTKLDSLRAERTSIVTVMTEAFTDTSQNAPTYVATLAQIEPNQQDASFVHMASYDPAKTSPNIVSTTTVADPAKLAALMTRRSDGIDQESTNNMVLRAVTANRVNVRSGPSTSNPVLGQVVRSDVVRVISNPANNWVKIVIEGDGIEGYMSSRFLTPLSE